MKIFWWSEQSTQNYYGFAPALWYVDEQATAIQVYNDRFGVLQRLLSEGYVEVSWQTAETLSLPVYP